MKCDDGKPKCLRCSKSGRLCEYGQVDGQSQSTGARADPQAQSPRVQSDSRETFEDGTQGESATGDPAATQELPDSSQEQQAVPYFQSPCSAVAETSVPLQLNSSIETPQNDRLDNGNHNDQAPASLDSGFSTSPLDPGLISLLNTSPLEWYDLLARDAISNIQQLNDASTDGPRWNFPEITLSRRQTPGPPGCLEVEQGLGVEHRNNQTEYPSLSYDKEHKPWNTTHNIELSAVDITFLRYYTEVVGPMLDLFDPDRHFTNVVPHIALRNTGLLKSILAVGAKHMSLGLTHESNENVPGDHVAPNSSTPTSLAAATGLPSESKPAPAHMATQYYYETLQYLSQTLLYPSYADSREILATATMISTYEMFDADKASTSGDWEHHLRGSFWIQRSQDNDGESVDGLRRAVWWAWLRQDVWAAFQAGRPTLTIWRARKAIEELDSDELATRIIYICAKCIAFAASDKLSPNQDPRQRIEQGDRLLRTLDDWYRALPDSYQPVAVSMDPGCNAVFPPIWIHPPSHAGAMQMYHFARSTVLLNQPSMGGINAYCFRDKQLTESVKMVCGIANACQEHESAMAFVNAQALFGGKCLAASLPPTLTKPSWPVRSVSGDAERAASYLREYAEN